MDKEQIKILLVEDDEDDYIMTRDLISDLRNNKTITANMYSLR